MSTSKEPQNGHSAEIQEIITAPPSWLLKWGVTVFIGVLLSVGVISLTVHYPVAVKAKLIIYNAHTGAGILAPEDGELVHLLITNTQRVAAGQTIALLQPSNAMSDPRALLTIKSPRAGIISVAGLPHEGELIKKGRPLFFLKGDGNAFYAEINISQRDVKKVSPGQSVRLKLDSFRQADFGVLRGVVDTIGALPAGETGFVGRIKIINQSNSRITLKPGLTGEAEIIVDNRSLFSRLADHLAGPLFKH